MTWAPDEDADAIAEAALAAVGMDGMLLRCPLAIFAAFGVPVEPLRRGEVDGILDRRRRQVRVNMAGEIEVVRWRLAHECGHFLQLVCGIKLPHSEALASRVGRAAVIGEDSIRKALAVHPYADIPALYQSWLPAKQTAMRLWEVQMRRPRRVG